MCQGAVCPFRGTQGACLRHREGWSGIKVRIPANVTAHSGYRDRCA